MLGQRGKKPVVITVSGEEVVLQEPCTHCQGGTLAVYHPFRSLLVGECVECEKGLVDTPLFAAIKRHLGIYPELRGDWRGAPRLRLGPALDGFGEKHEGKGMLHFYPHDWRNKQQYQRGLCSQGDRRDQTYSEGSLTGGQQHCQNCERIKLARERA